jgi:hypothetical protein
MNGNLMQEIFYIRGLGIMTLRRKLNVLAIFALFACCAISPASAAILHHKSKKKSHSSKVHGQQGIDTARATQIQQALIREHYMDGSPSGQWDDATKAAMTKFQADNGWQTKLTPDSRALIKLGLGPSQEGAAPVTASSASSGAGAGASHTSSDTLGSAITAHSSSQNIVAP